MNNINDLRTKKMLQNLLADYTTNLIDSLLDTCADQEYRICLLELGLN